MPNNWAEAIENKGLKRNNLHLNRGFSEQPHTARESQFSNGYPKPKSKISVIKVNKNKLPPDFFPKSWSFQKKLPQFKGTHQLEQAQNLPQPRRRRIQSERLDISPEKTSFFGFFDSEKATLDIKETINSVKRGGHKKRKFQTRQQPKRQNMNLQIKRKYTPGSHSQRNDLIQLFPNATTTYEQIQTEIILNNNSSSIRSNKVSPRKQHQSRLMQIQDPQKERGSVQQRVIERKDLIGRQFSGYDMGVGLTSSPKKAINLRNLQQTMRQNGSKLESGNANNLEMTFSKEIDMHNMTFFNAKSSCLPPIKK